MTVRIRVIPCLDVRDGRVVKGVNFVDLKDAGDPVEQARDYDEAEAVELARHTDLPVIASGGVKGLDDIRLLAIHASDGIEGVITGRALYDGRLDLAAAIQMADKA